MDPIKVDFSGKGADRSKEIVIPPEKSVLKVVLSVVFALITGAVVYYFMLPPLNFKAIELYYFLGIVIASFVGFLALLSGVFRHTEYVPYIKRSSRVPLILIGVLVLTVAIGYLVGSQFFRAKQYSRLMDVDESRSFSEDLVTDFETIPKVDEDVTGTIAPTAMSAVADLDLEAQFDVYKGTAAASRFPQINFGERPQRLAMLQYENIIKWVTNMRNGIPGYILIDTASKESSFQKTKEPIRYSLSDHFGRYVNRVARFAYPSYMFDNPSFEIDDSGDPYWIIPRLDKTIGLFGGRDVIGIVLMNAMTGDVSYYSMDEVKTDAALRWIDRVYADDLIVEQYDFHGKYAGGFWNSILSQRNCVQTTAGSTNIALEDDVWLYTGVTSVTGDQSIIGFVLVNQRTKETRFYRVAGGIESAAQGVVEAEVAHLGYTASFPLLVNIGGEPTYFMPLKKIDTATLKQTVQMYAMANVRDWQNIYVTEKTLSGCMEKYLDMLKAKGVDVQFDMDDITLDDDPASADPGTAQTQEPASDTEPAAPAADGAEITGIVREIRSAVIGGNTVYYIRLDGDAHYYSISAKDSEYAVILNVGDAIRATATGSGSGNILKLSSLEPDAQ